MFGGKFIAVNAYIKIEFHLKILEKEEQTKTKTNRRKEITKIREEINEIENRRTMVKINKHKSTKLTKL